VLGQRLTAASRERGRVRWTEPLARLLGMVDEQVAVYGSSGFTSFMDESLVETAPAGFWERPFGADLLTDGRRLNDCRMACHHVLGKGGLMDWAGWAVFGVLATVLLTTVLIMAQLGGLTRMDLPLMLGTLFSPDPDRARVVGFFIHLANGQVFALVYAAAFTLLGRAGPALGAAFGLLHAAVTLTILVPLLPGGSPSHGLRTRRTADRGRGPGTARAVRTQLRSPDGHRDRRRARRVRGVAGPAAQGLVASFASRRANAACTSAASVNACR
jgi:hypothetical protein